MVKFINKQGVVKEIDTGIKFNFIFYGLIKLFVLFLIYCLSYMYLSLSYAGIITIILIIIGIRLIISSLNRAINANRDMAIELFEKGYERYGLGWEEADIDWGFKNRK